MELVKIELGTSLFYYIYLLACIGVFVGLYFLLRHKSEKVKKWVLFGILAFNFVLHFLKLAFPEYIIHEFPAIFRKCTPENICAVSTLIFPFIYLSNWKAGKDYMFYLGVISGIVGCVAPLPAVGLNFYSLEAIRCYICHASLWQVPLLMVIFGQHKLNYRRNWKCLVFYFAVLTIIIVNELVLIRLGWVNTSTLEEFFDPSNRDMGYAIGFPGEMKGVAKYLLWLTPKAWKDPCVPILWEFFPVIVFGGLYTLLASAYWEHGRMKADALFVAGKVKEIIKKLKSRSNEAKNSGDAADDVPQDTDEENN